MTYSESKGRLFAIKINTVTSAVFSIANDAQTGVGSIKNYK